MRWSRSRALQRRQAPRQRTESGPPSSPPGPPTLPHRFSSSTTTRSPAAWPRRLGPGVHRRTATCHELDRRRRRARTAPGRSILALDSLDAVGARCARAARPTAGARPFLLALCDSAGTAVGARLSQDGIVDDYVQHFPAPADAGPARGQRPPRGARCPPASACARRQPRAAAAATGATARAAADSVVLVVEDDEVAMHAASPRMLESEPIDLVLRDRRRGGVRPRSAPSAPTSC